MRQTFYSLARTPKIMSGEHQALLWWQHHAIGVLLSGRDRETGQNYGKDECRQIQRI